VENLHSANLDARVQFKPTDWTPCPTWITLKEIARGLGELVGSDKRNTYCSDQRFCVALNAGNGYKAEVGVNNESTGVQSHIMVEYGNLPIRCRFCWAFNHLLKDCPTLDGKRRGGDKRWETRGVEARGGVKTNNAGTSSENSQRNPDSEELAVPPIGEPEDSASSPPNEGDQRQLGQSKTNTEIGTKDADMNIGSIKGNQTNQHPRIEEGGGPSPHQSSDWQLGQNKKNDRNRVRQGVGSSGSLAPSQVEAPEQGQKAMVAAPPRSRLIFPTLSPNGTRLRSDVEMSDIPRLTHGVATRGQIDHLEPEESRAVT
jgi:hypothetical protein